MRFDKVDILKSKEKERVVSKTSWFEKINDFLTYTALIGAIPTIIIILLISQIKKGLDIIGPIVFLSIALGIGILLLYSLLNLDKLQRIKGTIKEQNRNAIKELAKELGWNIKMDNNEITIAAQTSNFFSTNWGRQILILYDGQDILINCQAFSLQGFKSPFHWSGNRDLEKMIKEEFEKRLKTTTR